MLVTNTRIVWHRFPEIVPRRLILQIPQAQSESPEGRDVGVAVATVVKSRKVLSGHIGYGICLLENDKSKSVDEA
jgi:hypothetical protein